MLAMGGSGSALADTPADAQTATAAITNALLLRDQQGGVHTLQDYTGQGKWTVMMIWASDCSVCNREAHEYVRFHSEHKDRDAVMLGLSLDGYAHKDEAAAFLKRHQINFPNLIGEAEEVAGYFTAMTGEAWVGTPTFLIYAPDGELRVQQAGAVPPQLIADFIASEK